MTDDKPKYDAELHDPTNLVDHYVGFIYGDSKGRWPDGTPIRCSYTVEVNDGILQTRNTRYKLVNKPAMTIEEYNIGSE